MSFISLKEAREKLADIKEHHPVLQFEVEFVKRTNGEYRVMKCQATDPAYVPGSPAKFKASDKDLMTVFDTEKKGFGSINLPKLTKMVINGDTFIIEENKDLIPNVP